MITADQLDRLCVLAYRVVQGDTHTLNIDDWDFLDEVAVHAEDVLALSDDTQDLEESWDDPYETLEDDFAETD